MAKKILTRKAKELAKDNAALAKAYNVSKSTSRDTVISIFRSIVHNRRALIGMIILIIYVLLAVVGPMVANPKMLKSDIRNRLAAPSWEHPLGTDNNGRDTLTQFIYGARNVLTVAFIAAVMTILIATTVGMLSGLIGGWADSILMFFTNIILTVPSMPIMMLLATVMSADNPIAFGFVLSIWSWAGLARAVRAQIMSR